MKYIRNDMGVEITEDKAMQMTNAGLHPQGIFGNS